MFCSLTYQPDTLNACRLYVSLIQDTQTQPFCSAVSYFSPITGLWVQFNPRENLGQKLAPKRFASYWFLCYIWAFISSEKRPLLFVFPAMTQHHSTSFKKDWRFLLRSCISIFVWPDQDFFYCSFMEARKYQIDEDRGGEILCSENRSTYIPTISTSQRTQQQKYHQC